MPCWNSNTVCKVMTKYSCTHSYSNLGLISLVASQIGKETPNQQSRYCINNPSHMPIHCSLFLNPSSCYMICVEKVEGTLSVVLCQISTFLCVAYGQYLWSIRCWLICIKVHFLTHFTWKQSQSVIKEVTHTTSFLTAGDRSHVTRERTRIWTELIIDFHHN